MDEIDALLAYHRTRAAFADSGLPAAPARRVAIVACMDARLDLHRLLGLAPGDAHVIRNAGGVVTDDVERSLLLSQRLLGTREIMVIQHTECGLETFTDDALRAEIAREVGAAPPFALEAFTDVHASVRRSLARIMASAFIPHTDRARGFVYDVRTGRLHEVG